MAGTVLGSADKQWTKQTRSLYGSNILETYKYAIYYTRGILEGNNYYRKKDKNGEYQL